MSNISTGEVASRQRQSGSEGAELFAKPSLSHPRYPPPKFPTGRHTSTPRRRSAALRWFWVLFWLIFLVEPIATNVTGTMRQRVGAAGLALGGGIYAVHANWVMSRMFVGKFFNRRAPLLSGTAACTVAVIMLLTATLIAQDAFALLPYAAVMLALGQRFPIGLTFALALITALSAVAKPFSGTAIGLPLLFAAVSSAVAAALGAHSIQRGVDADRAAEEAHLLRLQDERNRMARDLHDILGHSLTVITVKAELVGKLIDADAEQAKKHAADLETLARAALADVRRTVSGYREMSLAGELVRARNALTDAGIRARVPSSVDEVDPEARELFAWVVREATTNVIRHSGASNCTIDLEPHHISVSDDGGGVTGRPEGNGLRGLRERAEAIGAHIHVADDPSRGGCRIDVRLPEQLSAPSEPDQSA